MINSKKISMSLKWIKEERSMFYSLANRNGFGLEIQAFVMPQVFYTKNDYHQTIETYKSELTNFHGVRSLHGPIRNIIPHAEDQDILAVVKDRVRKTLEASKELNCFRVIFHTDINPVVTAPGYYENIAKLQAKFWNEILDEFPDFTICLENMWESSPDIFNSILEKSGNPRLRICFDVAHANVYSKVPINEWFEKLRHNIIHIHVNDNNGDFDSHMALGKGNINWAAVFKKIVELESCPTIVIENSELKEIEESLKYLEKIGVIDAVNL